MTVLKIYYLEDNKETDPVSTLEDGEHIIGRGETLNCNDKRVSRKHALINIQKDRVFIKSVHINPCFFKAANGKSIEILKKDESLTLNDGDNFALLADNYWFRVKILNQSSSHVQDNDIQDPEGVNDTSIPLSYSSKRCHTDANSSESCKRTKLSNDEFVDINSSVTLSSSPKVTPVENLPKSSPSCKPSVDLDDLLSSSSNVNVAKVTPVENLSKSSPSRKPSVDLDDLLSSSSNVNVAKLTPVENLPKSSPSRKPSVDLGDLLSSSSNVNVAKVTPVENLPKSSPSRKPLVDLDDLLSSSSNVNVAHTETKVLLDNLENIINENKAVEVKEEISDSEESVDFLEIATSDGNVKTVEDASTTIRTDENDSVEVKTADVDTKVKVEVNNTNANDPSGSTGTNNQQQSTRRDRCWYGSTCYRKNVTHRADFSHPGDPDYDDDSTDVRPDCPFGSACYRTNLDHRKQYKHSSKPAPKPSNQGQVTHGDANSLVVAESSECETDNDDVTKRKRKLTKIKKNYNESPIDDYDFNDPFIDDASSDEFQISTDDDGSTDWEDSEKIDEEAQETKRLLKEAKRFTKKQKKK